MKNRLKSIVFLLIIFSLFTAFLEILFTTFWPVKGEPALQEPYFGIKQALKPNYQSRMTSNKKEFDYPIHTNSKRLRGEEVQYSKKDGEYRILVLGDSQTFGLNVPEKETYSEHLENFLNENNKFQKHKFTVINAGMPGTGTYDQMIFLKNEGIKYKPDLVILGLYKNDFEDNMDKDNGYEFEEISYNKNDNKLFISGFQYHEYDEIFPLSLTRFVFNSLPFYDYLSRHSSLLNFIKQRLRVLIEKTRSKKENALLSLLEQNNIVESVLIDKDINKTVKSNSSSPERLASLIITESLISRMADFSNEHKADFLVVVIPTREEVIGAVQELKYSFIGRNNTDINFHNLVTSLKNIEKNELSFLYYPGDFHLSPTGHLAAGYFIAVSVINSFLNKSDFNEQKLEESFENLMKSTQSKLTTKLYSLKDYPEFHYYKALVLALNETSSKTDVIISELKRSLKLHSDKNTIPDNMTYFYLGYYERIAGHVEDAIQHLQQVESSSMLLSATAKRELGFCWLMKKNIERAEIYFKESISLNPNEAKSLFGLGQIYIAQKQYMKAVGFLKKAKEISPDDISILNIYNYAITQTGQ